MAFVSQSCFFFLYPFSHFVLWHTSAGGKNIKVDDPHVRNKMETVYNVSRRNVYERPEGLSSRAIRLRTGSTAGSVPGHSNINLTHFSVFSACHQQTAVKYKETPAIDHPQVGQTGLTLQLTGGPGVSPSAKLRIDSVSWSVFTTPTAACFYGIDLDENVFGHFRRNKSGSAAWPKPGI